MKHVYFPINNLNSQGWITDFITSKISRSPRDQLANAFYGNVDHKSKIFSIHPKFHDEIQSRCLTPKTRKDSVEYAKYLKFMSNIRPEQVAALYPKLQLSYIYQKDKKSPKVKIPFPFRLTTDVDSILENAFSRGDGSGIQSMTTKREFKYLGDVMNVEVDLSFYFQSMSTFTKEIEHKKLPSGVKFSFIKLISALKPNEKIELEYGWGASHGVENALIPTAMIEAINKYETKKFLLHYINHDLSFEKDGSISLRGTYYWSGEAGLYAQAELTDIDKKKIDGMDNIEVSKKQKKILKKAAAYKSSIKIIEEYLKNTKPIKRNNNPVTLTEDDFYDELLDELDGPRISSGFLERQNRLSKSDKSLKALKKVRRKKDRLNKKLNSLNREIRQGLSGFIIDNLILEHKMFHVNFKTSKSNAVVDNIYTAEADISKIMYVDGKKEIFKIKTIQDQVRVEKIQKAYTLMYDKIFNINSKGKYFGDATFFSFRSLAEVVYSLLNKEQAAPLPLMCLGNVTARSSDDLYTINIGDVLIETKTFQDWFYTNFIRTDLANISFIDFMNEAMEDLIPTVLNENLVLDNSQTRIGVIKKTFLTYEGNVGDPLFAQLYERADRFALEQFLEKTSDRGLKIGTPMVIFHEVKTTSTSLNSGYFSKIIGNKTESFNEIRDSKLGIPHIKIGADDGLLINVSFAGVGQPGIRTSYWLAANKDSTESIMTEHYTATLSLIGNNIFFKGGYFAIPSNPLGGRGAFDPGIVGYYSMISVTDSIDSNGNYTTQVSGPWMDNPEARKRTSDKAKFKEKIDTNKIDDHTKHFSSITYIKDYLDSNIELGDNVGLNDNKAIKKLKKLGF